MSSLACQMFYIYVNPDIHTALPHSTSLSSGGKDSGHLRFFYLLQFKLQVPSQLHCVTGLVRVKAAYRWTHLSAILLSPTISRFLHC